FVRPVVIGDQPLELHIALEPEDNGALAFEIYSGQGDETLTHSQGRALLAAAAQVPTIDLAALRAQCVEREMSAQECYTAFARMGLAYGPGHQGLKRLCWGHDAQGALLLGDIDLPAAVADTQGAYLLHPSLMDAALQAAMGMLENFGAMGVEPMLPFALQRLEVFAAVPVQTTVVVRHSAGSGAQDAMQKLDLDIVDAHGQVCVRMSGFSSRTLAATPQAQEL